MHVSRLNRLGRVLRRASGLATLLVLGGNDALAQRAAGPVLKPLTQYHLESWQTRDGLPTNGLQALAQDADGFLWLGTEAGLVRFDGVQFRTFDRNSTPALKATEVTALFVDKANRLWIGTDDGSVLRRRDGVFEEFSQVRLSGPISTFYQDQRGVIWVAAGDSVARVSENALLLVRGANASIQSIYEDANGVVMLGTNGPLGRIENDTIKPIEDGARDVRAALRQPDGTLWQALPTGLRRTGGRRPERLFTTAHGLPSPNVTALALDHRGGLWIGTTAGVARLVGDRLVSRTGIREPDSEGMNVTALLEDREGSIWVATRHGGLHQLRNVPFEAITKRHGGLAHDDVLAVFEDHAANLWVGTDGAGLTQLHDGTHFTWTAQEGLPSNVIWTLAETRDGAIWIGTPKGLARILHGRITSFAGVGGYPQGGIRAILEDRRGNLWIGSSRQGLWRLRGSEVKQFTKENDGLSSNSITVLRESREGALWIGTTDGGLDRMSRGLFTNYSVEQGLRSNDVTAVLCEDQHVWVGTTDGSLHLVRNDRVLALPTKDGASTGHALQILADRRGSIWMTGERGITRLERSELLKVANSNVEAATARVYDFRDGFGRWEFQGVSQSSGIRRADGSLAFPSATGVVIVRSEAFTTSNVAPTVKVLEVLADGRPIPVEQDLVLPAGVKQLEVRYTATSLAVPSRVMFRYKLEGADADWMNAGPLRSAFYSNLSGGRYRFHVTATNSDGVASPHGATLAWRVELQFWETWWFYALGGVGFLFTVLQLSRFRVRRGQARERALRVIVDERTAELSQEIAERRRVEASLRTSRDELEDRVAERTTELRAALAQTQKDMAERRRLEEQLAQVQKLESIGRLAGGVAHDINNVLTVVLSYSDLVDAGLGAAHPLQAQLRQIRKAAERASNLTHRLLAFARKQIVEPRVINLGELSLNLDGMLRRLIGEDVELLTVTSPNLWSVKADPHQIEQVLVNLAVNARDAMPQGGTLRIETTNVVVDEAFAKRHPTLKTGEHVRMSVSDTGVGMDEHVMQHMFEPFFTTKEPGKGTGLGLATCYGIVQQLGGAIYPESELGKGTIFSVFVPRVDLPAEPTPRPRETSVQRGTETVLLVEDEPLVRDIAKSALSDQGYEVLEAEHGEEALALARGHGAEIQLVLTDVVMPKMGGRELVEQLRKVRPAIRVLYMSGYTAASIDEQDVVEPGTSFLRKPFALAEMLGKVREVLDATRATASGATPAIDTQPSIEA
jgi:signal transduction histidine kinase/ligand-binding sensor domain-containing protein/ActR/RegA family two-component response regulator